MTLHALILMSTIPDAELALFFAKLVFGYCTLHAKFQLTVIINHLTSVNGDHKTNSKICCVSSFGPCAIIAYSNFHRPIIIGFMK